MLFTWKHKCKKAASFLDSYNWEHRREEEELREVVREASLALSLVHF